MRDGAISWPRVVSFLLAPPYSMSMIANDPSPKPKPSKPRPKPQGEQTMGSRLYALIRQAIIEIKR